MLTYAVLYARGDGAGAGVARAAGAACKYDLTDLGHSVAGTGLSQAYGPSSSRPHALR